MVSLSQHTRQPGGGMTFFTDSMSSFNRDHDDDDPLLDAMPVLPQEPAVCRWMAEEMKKFRTIGTVKAIIVAKFLYVCLGLAAYLLPVFCKDNMCRGQSVTSMVMYLHGGMWFLLLLVHMYLYYEHRKSLLHGYFSFHLETRTLRRAPLFINSGANAILVVLSKILDYFCHPNGHCPFLTKNRYLQMLISLEVLIALVLLLIYLVKTMVFNRARETPDFLRTGSAEQTARLQSQIGFRKGSYKDEKEVAMTMMWYELFFWKHKRVSLCHNILRLHDELEAISRPDDSQGSL